MKISRNRMVRYFILIQTYVSALSWGLIFSSRALHISFWTIGLVSDHYFMQEPILRLFNLQLQRQRCSRLERFLKYCSNLTTYNIIYNYNASHDLQLQRQRCSRLERVSKSNKIFCCQNAPGYPWRCKNLHRWRCNSRS
jgi:hypothetical protein